MKWALWRGEISALSPVNTPTTPPSYGNVNIMYGQNEKFLVVNLAVGTYRDHKAVSDQDLTVYRIHKIVILKK
jgi:hypothetical protein